MDPSTAPHDYITQVVRLMIWHVWGLSRREHPVPIQEALDRNVDIMRKTRLYDGRRVAEGLDPPVPEWDLLKAELASRIAAHDSSDTEPLEDACWALLDPYIDRDRKAPDHKARPYKCWEYDIPSDKSHAIDLHFGNAYRPDSPFRMHRHDLIATLRRLVEDAVAARPDLTTIQCDSWLSQYGPFAALFPPAWHASFVPVFNYLDTHGWWGQYVDRRGGFHEKRAQEFRSTGTHPYSAGICECGIGEVLEYLRESCV